MLSHDNVTWTSRIGAEQYSWDQERFLSYLPLSHIAGIMQDIFIAIYAANEVHFADKEVLKSTLSAVDKKIGKIFLLSKIKDTLVSITFDKVIDTRVSLSKIIFNLGLQANI